MGHEQYRLNIFMAKSETQIVKTPYQRLNFTEEQLREFVKCADPVTGPLYFMNNYMYIQHPTRGSVLYVPYEYQTRLIETYHKYRYNINLLPRQTGKCVNFDSVINICNSKTGKTYSLPIGIYYEFIKAQRDGTPGPDISKFETQEL